MVLEKCPLHLVEHGCRDNRLVESEVKCCEEEVAGQDRYQYIGVRCHDGVWRQS